MLLDQDMLRTWSSVAAGFLSQLARAAQDLYEAAGPAASELDLRPVGHMQFAQLGGIERLVADDLCGHNASLDNAQVGPTPLRRSCMHDRKAVLQRWYLLQVMRSTADLMLAWFAKHSSAQLGGIGRQTTASL